MNQPTQPPSTTRTKLPIRSRIKPVRYGYIAHVGGVGGGNCNGADA